MISDKRGFKKSVEAVRLENILFVENVFKSKPEVATQTGSKTTILGTVFGTVTSNTFYF